MTQRSTVVRFPALRWVYEHHADGTEIVQDAVGSRHTVPRGSGKWQSWMSRASYPNVGSGAAIACGLCPQDVGQLRVEFADSSGEVSEGMIVIMNDHTWFATAPGKWDSITVYNDDVPVIERMFHRP